MPALVALGLAVAGTVPRSAAANHVSACLVPGIPGVIAAPISTVVDLGFSINAIVAAKEPPGYPSSAVAKAQIGLMVPQIVVSSVGLVASIAICKKEDRFVIALWAVPLAWSIALLGHGAWALQQSERAMQAAMIPGLMTSSAHSVQLRVAPMTSPGTVGLSLGGDY